MHDTMRRSAASPVSTADSTERSAETMAHSSSTSADVRPRALPALSSIIEVTSSGSNEPPLTTLTLEGDEGTNEWFLSDVGVTLVSSGGTGSIAGTWYRLDGGSWQDYGGEFTVSGDGVHALQYYSSDTAGNNEPVRSVDIMIDTEAPESSASVTGTLGNGGWFVGPATVAFTFNDSTRNR